jgi:hypothetical protein
MGDVLYLKDMRASWEKFTLDVEAEVEIHK